jgi:hypothetical protein
MQELKKYIAVSFLAVASLLISCKDTTGPEEAQQVTLKGIVVRSDNLTTVADAIVRVADRSEFSYSDANGGYSLTVPVDSASSLRLVAFKEGFGPDTTEVYAVPGRIVDVPALKLKAGSTSPGTRKRSGNASNIVLVSVSDPDLSVKSTGGNETCTITFEVRDANGVPVDAEHARWVRFEIVGGGDAFVTPTDVNTDTLTGRVTAIVNSGTIASAILVRATTEYPAGRLIASIPVALTVHGGPPHRDHFGIAVQKFNFPGYNVFGLRDGISVYVGDRYSNPARVGSAVYFTTTGGIIEASGFTDKFGEAKVDLISAEPRPYDNILGAGFATITAQTIDENRESIYKTAVVLFSGLPWIRVSPTSFAIPDMGMQLFNYTVSDQNGNPLSSGTNISVSAQGGSVSVAGQSQVTLPDTQNRRWTEFSFQLLDTAPKDSLPPQPVVIKISVTGPNGNEELTISGTAD